jgi:hypothetical protein
MAFDASLVGPDDAGHSLWPRSRRHLGIVHLVVGGNVADGRARCGDLCGAGRASCRAGDPAGDRLQHVPKLAAAVRRPILPRMLGGANHVAGDLQGAQRVAAGLPRTPTLYRG